MEESDIKLIPVLVYGFIDVEEGSDQILNQQEVEKSGLSIYTNGIYEGTNGFTKNWPVYGIIVKPGYKIKQSIETKIQNAIKTFTKKYSIEIDNLKIGFFNCIKVEDSEGNIDFDNLDDYFENQMKRLN